MVDNKTKKEKPQEPRHADPATIKCKVHRTNVDPQNELVPITVNAVGRTNGKKQFVPKTEINLTQVQINILRAAVEEHDHLIPDESGIYQAADPLKMARNYYPGCDVKWDKTTGHIRAFKRVPNYIVEIAPPGGFQP